MKIDDKVIEKIGGQALRFKIFLDNLPDGEVLTYEEIAKKIGSTKESLGNLVRRKQFGEYRITGRRGKAFFGNKKYIALLKKELKFES